MRNRILTGCMILLLTCGLQAQVEVYVSTGTGSASAIKRFDQNGNYLDDFMVMQDGFCVIDWSQDILFDSVSNSYLVSSLNTGEIVRYDAMTGSCIGVFANVQGGPTRMKIGPDNLLYVVQWSGNGKVRRYHMDGAFVDEFTSVGIPAGIGIDWDTAGNLYVSSYSGHFIRKFDNAGLDQGLFISSGLQGPTNIWFDGSEQLMVLNWDGNQVKKFASDGTFLSTVISGIVNPEGIAFLPNGNFLVGNGGTNGKVTEYSPDGTEVGVFASGNGLSYPNGLYVKEISDLSIAMNNAPDFLFYPSTGNYFTRNSESSSATNVYDLTGRSILVIQSGTQTWDAGDLPEGMYLLISDVNGQTVSQKIQVVQG